MVTPNVFRYVFAGVALQYRALVIIDPCVFYLTFTASAFYVIYGYSVPLCGGFCYVI